MGCFTDQGPELAVDQRKSGPGERRIEMKAFQLMMAARRWAADAVSLSRVVLLVPLVRLMVLGSPWAMVVLSLIVASDLADGRIARRLGTAGSRGALIDASCDVLVVMSAAIAAGLSDARYAALAAVMAMAFLSYGAFSLLIGRFAYTRLGRYDGVVSYGVIAVTGAKPLFALIGFAVPAAAEWIVLSLSTLFLAVSTAENVAGIAGEIRKKESAALERGLS
jgi:CDP-diacylglycerol--glycerol-3-phosphate 3-phosphatidyltransferase